MSLKRAPKVRLIDRSVLAINDTGASRERPEAWFRSPDHLAWIRKQPCPFCDMPNGHAIEACHIRYRTDGASAVKPSDCFTFPGCWLHHRRQHFVGEQTFFADHSIQDAAMWAVTRYAMQSPCPKTREAAGRWLETGKVMP